MSHRIEHAKEKWQALRTTSGFKNAMLFLVFVGVSTIIWFVLALNDNAQDHFNVRLQISNMPDSVTFISDVPEKLGVTVNDKGTSLWRHGYLKHPSINIDFKEYATDGILRFSYSDLQSAMKEAFGGGAQIASISVDSLQLLYTTNPGKKVPVAVNCDVVPTLGFTIEGAIKATPGSVYLYGAKEVIDTINYVSTENIKLTDISENTTISARIKKEKGVRILPSKVDLTIPIEPLVKKEALVTVEPVNVPGGEDLLLFPSKVPVEYFVAMSRLGDDEDNNIKLVVDYDKMGSSNSSKLKVETVHYPDRLKNLKVITDSVEYAVVRK